MGRHSLKKKFQLQQEREREQQQQAYYGHQSNTYYQPQNYQPQQIEVPRIKATEYEKPQSTLKNFPSSIVNGVTKEGGIFSLTLKSIHCAKYVENIDNMRRCFKKQKLDIPKISNINCTRLLEDVQRELNAVKSEQIPTVKFNNDEITKLNEKLSKATQNGSDIKEVSDTIEEEFIKNGKIKIFGDKEFEEIENLKLPIEVELAPEETKEPEVEKVTETIVEEEPDEMIKVEPTDQPLLPDKTDFELPERMPIT
ncbi:hypothetical protein KGF54_002739 [Candida jiufengensis]|uniref:uncharacterized protein n=1 Tax=Candida jiufengensis TaxID=497108 RepID=UPI0022256D41|nr:uncharacterized protein KGF54_002739 [Candida jiufengensis]KAI5953368.1 hypothetical protein KGF54_002739 [Candida jiufengensis]